MVWQPWAGRAQWASNHLYWSRKYCGLNSLHRHHYLWKLKRSTIFCVCMLAADEKTLQSPERIKNLAEVNSVIISKAAMPYGLWQGSPPIKAGEEKQPWCQVSIQALQRSLPSLQLSVECRDCILPACRLNEATCQDGTSQCSMYM